MGSGRSKANLLRNYELDEFAKVTAFNIEDINNLYTHFKTISTIQKDDGVIDYNEFCSALETDQSLITQRLFQIFDENHDSVLNFREFIAGIAILNENNLDMQIKLTFKIFDPETTGIIKSSYVTDVLLSSLKLLNTMHIPRETIEEMVKKTFDEANSDVVREDKSMMDFSQYRKMVRTDPAILKWLSLDMERIQHTARLLLKFPKKYQSAPIKSK